MNVEQIFKEAYLETNTSKAELSYDDALVVFNELYRQIRKRIVNQDKYFFWTYWTTDIQADVNEYAIQREEMVINEWQEDQYIVPWIARVQRVYYNWEELPELDDSQERAWMRWYRLKDNHIILNFMPDEDIEDWLKIDGIQNINKLTLESEEEDIFPWHEDLADFSDVLYLGLKEKLYRVKKDQVNIQIAKQDYQEAIMDMIRFISTRTKSIYHSELNY